MKIIQMTRQEVYKEVEKDLLTHFDGQILMKMYERLALMIIDSTLKAINYTCECDNPHCQNGTVEVIHGEPLRCSNCED